LGAAWGYYWRVFYYLDARFSPVLVMGLCAGVGAALVGFAALLKFRVRSFAARGALCLALAGTLFVFANPPMQAPDESQYFLRCYAISEGHFDFDANRAVPADAAALYHAFPGAWVNAHTSEGVAEDPETGEPEAYSTAGYALKQTGENGPVQSVTDSFAAYFSRADTTEVKEPVSFLVVPFLPQALGMALARLVGFSALGCLYGGRLANLAVYVLLCWLALKKAERFRPLLLGVMLLPLSLFLGASLSYDATLLGCYYLMAALLTRRQWGSRAAAAYLTACVFVNIAKPYLNLLWVFLPLALPKTVWKAKGSRWLWLAGCFAGTLGMTALTEWYGTAFRTGYGAIERMGGQDVDQLAQLAFLFQNPLRYLAVLMGTLYENDFFLGQLGLFGWKDLPVSLLNLTGPLVFLGGALLCAAECVSRPPLARRTRAGFGLFALLYGVGAMTAMYITYTPVTMVRIVGLQARYFLPVWLLSFALLALPLGRILRPQLAPAHAETLAVKWFAPYAVLGALLLFQHYFIGPVYTI
jgi:hypothetical protein